MSRRYKILAQIVILSATGLLAAIWISVAAVQANRTALDRFAETYGAVHALQRMDLELGNLQDMQDSLAGIHGNQMPAVIRSYLITHEAALISAFANFRDLQISELIAHDIETLEQRLQAVQTDLDNALERRAPPGISEQYRLSVVIQTARALTSRMRDQLLREAKASSAQAREALLWQTGGALGVVALALSAAIFLVQRHNTRMAATLRQLALEMNNVRDGHAPSELPLRACTDEIGAIARSVAAFSETFADLTMAQSRFEHLASHDALTDLANRVNLHNRLGALLNPAQKNLSRFCAMQIEIHPLNEINATYGHSAGDAILRHVADILKSQLGADDMAARTSGNSFVILLFDQITDENLGDMAQSIIDRVAQPFDYNGKSLLVQTNIGIARSETADGADRMLANTEIALYLAKGAGRDQYSFFPDLAEDLDAISQDLLKDLRAALEHDGVQVFFQPQIEGSTGAIAGAEALVRWRHPTRGLLMPGQFLELARANDLDHQLSEIVIEQALSALAHWRALQIPVPMVSVNLSARDLRRPGLAARLEQKIWDHRLVTSDLAIELDETTLADEETGAVVQELKSGGFRIAVDDFGTGAVSTTTLRAVQLDQIKIDRSLVTGVAENPEQKRQLTRLIDLCDDLGVPCLVEGVENDCETETLADMGCRLFQGYALAMPMDQASATRWLTARLGKKSA